VSKDREATQERFSKAEQDYAKMLEEMKLANVKRKKTMQLLETEKQNYERLQKLPEENKVNGKLFSDFKFLLLLSFTLKNLRSTSQGIKIT